MNPRFLPGGDKYDSIRDDERRSFYELVQAEQQDILDSIRCRVRSWTSNELENRDEPTYLNFIAEYYEYRAEAWESLIVEEMTRTVNEENERENFGLPFELFGARKEV